jgi:hypothetical protein
LDASFVAGEWLWKLEALYRMGQGSEEGIFDDRGSRATTAFEGDIAIAARLAVNDAASSEALLGWVQDANTSARFLFLEASRRFGDHWTLSLELRTFMDQPASDFLYDLRDDDLLQMELSYYF